MCAQILHQCVYLFPMGRAICIVGLQWTKTHHAVWGKTKNDRVLWYPEPVVLCFWFFKCPELTVIKNQRSSPHLSKPSYMLFETLNSSTLVVTGHHITGLALTITIDQIGMGNITFVLMKLGWALSSYWRERQHQKRQWVTSYNRQMEWYIKKADDKILKCDKIQCQCPAEQRKAS
jgi:hypothetical protein